MLPEHILQWFLSRGIKPETLKKFNISWNGSSIVIPIYTSEGRFLFNKYRRDPDSNSGPKYFYTKGSKVSLYNFNKEINKVFLVEGELDAVRLSQEGYNVSSTTGGATSFKSEWAKYFENKEVFVFYDNDLAGACGTYQVICIIPQAKIIPFPRYSPFKDITEFLQNNSIEKFEELIKQAYSLPKISETATREEIDQALEDCILLRRELNGKDLSSLPVDECVNRLAQIRNSLGKFNRKTRIKHNTDSVKNYPISNLIQFQHNFTNCIWHKEKTASLKYYPDTNSVYCFGCKKSGDVITVYRVLHPELTFKQAVEELNKLV